MKKNIITIALLTLGLTACKKDFLSLETNPNAPSSTTPQFTLAGALKVSADISNTSSQYNAYATWAGQWAPSGNYVPSVQLQQYNFDNTFYQTWTPLYQNATNFNNLVKFGLADASFAKFQAIGMIMKVYDFQQLVDSYNNVPYTDAFQAPSVLFPKYDNGSDIYNDLASKLDDAIKLINSSSSAVDPGSSDIMFKGDMTKWKKFANTLKLRLAIRLSNLGGGAAKSTLATTASEGYIDDTFQATLNPGYTNSDAFGGQESPFWRVYGFDQNGNPIGGSNDYWRANAFEVNLLKSLNDPRLTKVYAPVTADASGSTYTGIVFGSSTASPNPNTSGIGTGLLKSPTMDAVVFSSAQSLFLQAEAVARGYISGNAASLYNRAITASFNNLNVANASTAAANYYAQQSVAYPAGGSLETQVNAIITQKYIAVTGYERSEAFFEFKRTGYPTGVPRSVDLKAAGTTIPNRVYYPASEYSNNANNVATQGTINIFSSKIFWAK
ncbi:SusD/RagB family nutrient-binding outer membrane lipoprotein [Mucilaginibacter sp. 21P]|uniref:SusD/RagB family nutrient-binding outer membrane lipoprotein n=1 Tax=Mucilaginibacter sp. 21P TaxID=2778902 RepID=UPI001C58915B|nr:SusD/RagB family nutrient-binding outer membrane lipoprotein [Mucilaginibacter sp. 21P]QXV66258.1 SusD/RagB family nutrient-binding outer membrane lipoprotein [Mucilaginibacter sp. 21P]